MSEAIVTRNLGRHFNGEWALRGLDLTIPRGEIFGLVGPNGAGKTKALRILTGVLAQSEGEAFVAGFPVSDGEEAIKRHIAYMSQRFGLYPDLGMEENMHFYADLYQVPRGERGKNMERLLGFRLFLLFPCNPDFPASCSHREHAAGGTMDHLPQPATLFSGDRARCFPQGRQYNGALAAVCRAGIAGQHTADAERNALQKTHKLRIGGTCTDG